MTSSDPAILKLRPRQEELDLSKTLMDKNDFMEGVRHNRQTLEPIEVGHRAISISQIGLIACQVGEKLKWNPGKEIFEGNNYANSLLAAPLTRSPWH